MLQLIFGGRNLYCIGVIIWYAPSILLDYGYIPSASPWSNRNRRGYTGTYPMSRPPVSILLWINLVSDWSGAKSPGRGAMPIIESIVSENASQPSQKTRGVMLPYLLPSFGYSASAHCWTSICVFIAKPTFSFNATSVFCFSLGSPWNHSARSGSLWRLPSFCWTELEPC